LIDDYRRNRLCSGNGGHEKAPVYDRGFVVIAESEGLQEESDPDLEGVSIPTKPAIAWPFSCNLLLNMLGWQFLA
jgi:hypothetical protein